MVTFRRGETITRLRRNLVTDPYSLEQTLGPWAEASSADIYNVAIAPSATFAQADPARSQIVTAMSAFADADADIRPLDRLVTKSGVWDVEADTQVWRNPYSGRYIGLEVRISRAEG